MKDGLYKLNFIKMKMIFSVKDSVKRMKRQAIDGKEVYTKDVPDKDLLPKLYELSNVPVRI